MTNARSIAGAAAWMMVTLTLAFAALAPVEAALWRTGTADWPAVDAALRALGT